MPPGLDYLHWPNQRKALESVAKAVNDLTRIDIAVHYVVEFSAKLGIGKDVSLFSAKVTVVDIPIADAHFHLNPFFFFVDS